MTNACRTTTAEVVNPELQRLILGYGGHVEVMEPPAFRERVAESVRMAASHYERKN